MNNKFVLKSGRTLKLRRLSQTVLNDLISQLTLLIGVDPTTDPEALNKLETHQKIEAIALTNRLATYCYGWGIKDSPNGNESELLNLLGYGDNKPHLRRSTWVATEMCADDEERGLLMGDIMAFANTPVPPKKKRKKKRKKKQRVLEPSETAVNDMG